MGAEFLDATPLERLTHCLTHPPHNLWMGATAISADEDKKEITVGLTARPEMSMDPSQIILHGGMMASLIDITGHATVAVWHRSVTPTISLQIDYLSPAAGTDFVARGFLRKLGRSLARADIEVWTGTRIVALGRGTYSTL